MCPDVSIASSIAHNPRHTILIAHPSEVLTRTTAPFILVLRRN
jgi:hypothetical protein